MLKNFTQLESLNLRGTRVTSKVFEHIASLKNLRDLNDHMDHECRSSAARYGITLEASLITEIDPPQEVESALAAINTAHNQVSSEISLAQASADQKIVQSRRAVEIETLRAEAARARATGYRAVKLKLGAAPLALDLARARAVRETLSPA